jgi:hypothetical protein
MKLTKKSIDAIPANGADRIYRDNELRGGDMITMMLMVRCTCA